MARPRLEPSALGAERLASMVDPRIAAQADTKLQTVQSPLTTTGEQLDEPGGYYALQQLLRVWRGQGSIRRRMRAGCRRGPWSVKIEGKVAKPQTFDIDDLLNLRPLEDRVYRHRCVEAWSMVIPWVGYSLSEFIKQCEPLP